MMEWDRTGKSLPPAPIGGEALAARRKAAEEWFAGLRDKICAVFESIEAEYAAQHGGGRARNAPASRNKHGGGRARNAPASRNKHGGGDGDTAPATFTRTAWQRDHDHKDSDGGGRTAKPSASRNHHDGGGGVMSVMRGQVFEKVGVNISTVAGEFGEAMRGHVPGSDADPGFWASGISLVAHPVNPFAPTVHMNTRYINAGGAGGSARRWFGGGADITPMMPHDHHREDIADFHAAFKAACDAHDAGYYPAMKKWCDDYFRLPHRGEARGAGGIFYDYLPDGHGDGGDGGGDGGDGGGDDAAGFNAAFAFTRDVGLAFLAAYPPILRRRMATPFTAADRDYQLRRRGRYAEFNLLYDRGTVFGLRTGGNVEAILMSLPPEVRWP